jgi:hypothetical protein
VRDGLVSGWRSGKLVEVVFQLAMEMMIHGMEWEIEFR